MRWQLTVHGDDEQRRSPRTLIAGSYSKGKKKTAETLMIVRLVTYSLAGPFTQLVVADEVGPTGEYLEGILDTSQGSPVLSYRQSVWSVSRAS